jgi:hypothetical protein
MEKHNDPGLHANQKTQGVWERRTGDRRLGQNQLFGSFRVNAGVRVLSQSDPTDDALAAIASILKKPGDMPIDKPPDTPIEKPASDAIDEPEIASSEEVPVVSQPAQSSEPPQPTAADGDTDDTYIKQGPGPLDAIRLKWTIRPAGDGTYFIDETIGDGSRAVTSGPMPKQEAINFIDGRERDARRRFDALKNEMTGQGAFATNPARNDNGKI